MAHLLLLSLSAVEVKVTTLHQPIRQPTTSTDLGIYSFYTSIHLYVACGYLKLIIFHEITLNSAQNWVYGCFFSKKTTEP